MMQVYIFIRWFARKKDQELHVLFLYICMQIDENILMPIYIYISFLAFAYIDLKKCIQESHEQNVRLLMSTVNAIDVEMDRVRTKLF